MASNFYSAAKSNPEVLEKRKQKVAALNNGIQQLQTKNPGRIPDWEEERVMLVDRAALELGKRCIMWDDAGNGFFLMLNWDWVANRPAHPPTAEAAFEPGWWVNVKQLLLPPLLDASVPEHKLASWIDAHTMRIHHRLLKKLDKVKAGNSDSGAAFVLEDEYWQQLQSLPR